MSLSAALTHLREAVRWSTEERIEAAEVLAAGFGMAVPVMLGLLTGHPAAGFVAALGAFAVGRVVPGSQLATHARREIEALAPMACAALFVIAFERTGQLADVLIVAAAAVAAMFGSYSRQMAVATTRFILFLMIVSAVPAPNGRADLHLLACVFLGALWTSSLGYGFGRLARRAGPPAAPLQQPMPSPATARQAYAHWKRSLRTFAGWSFPVRLTTGLCLGVVADHHWPGHHFHWIGLTVALLTPRDMQVMSVKATQRFLGTAIGVVVTGLALQSGLPEPAFIAAVGVLAGIRPLLKLKNYLAYSVVMTPLVILIIDGGHAPHAGLLADRLLATAIGAALVTAASALALMAMPATKPV